MSKNWVIFRGSWCLSLPSNVTPFAWRKDSIKHWWLLETYGERFQVSHITCWYFTEAYCQNLSYWFQVRSLHVFNAIFLIFREDFAICAQGPLEIIWEHIKYQESLLIPSWNNPMNYQMLHMANPWIGLICSRNNRRFREKDLKWWLPLIETAIQYTVQMFSRIFKHGNCRRLVLQETPSPSWSVEVCRKSFCILGLADHSSERSQSGQIRSRKSLISRLVTICVFPETWRSQTRSQTQHPSDRVWTLSVGFRHCACRWYVLTVGQLGMEFVFCSHYFGLNVM